MLFSITILIMDYLQQHEHFSFHVCSNNNFDLLFEFEFDWVLDYFLVADLRAN